MFEGFGDWLSSLFSSSAPAAAATGFDAAPAVSAGYGGGGMDAFNFGNIMGAPQGAASGASDYQMSQLTGGAYGPMGGGDPPQMPTTPAGGPPPGTTAAAGAPALPTDAGGVGADGKYSSIGDLIKAKGFDQTQPQGFGDWAKSIMGDVKEYMPLAGLGATGVGLARQFGAGNGGSPPLSPLQQEQLNAMRQQRALAQQYQTGQVTPEMQQGVQAQTQANIQSIKDKYAKLGMSGSTSERQEIAAAMQAGQAQIGAQQAKMIQIGAQMAGVPTTEVGALTREQLAQDAAFMDALAKFAAAAGSMPQAQA